jgi:mono/diheme cytochrome c family protein
MKRTTSSSRPRCVTLLRQIWIAGLILCVALSLAVGQTSQTAKRNPRWSSYVALANVPEAALRRSNPFEGSARETEAGGKLYEQHCTECHGPKAGGTRYGPSLLNEHVEQASPGALFWVLTNGVVWHGMPVWSKLPEPERWQIVTFIESLKVHSDKPEASGGPQGPQAK